MEKLKLMEICLNVAKQNEGRTGENPSVGALIVKNGEIFTACTSFGGRPHAEENVIKKAKKNGVQLEGSTLFCTLEPCSHFGKTPPCVNAIIEAKISKVVVGMQDPDPRVNGRGIENLQNAGIEVETLKIKAIEDFYLPYIILKKKNRPYVCLKIACSIDGKIALQNGKSKWITNEKMRYFSNFLRSRFNGILVGGGTVLVDFPKLNCRINGLEGFSPKKFVASRQKVEGFNMVYGTVPEMLQQIADFGVQKILVEGGENLMTQFVQSNVFDELHLFQSGVFLGNDAKSAMGGLELLEIPLQKMKIKQKLEIDGNSFASFIKL